METLEAKPIEAVVPPAPVITPVEPENPNDFIEVHGTRVDLLENAAKLHLSNGATRIISYSDFSQILQSFLDKAQESKVTSLRLLPPNLYAVEESINQIRLGFYFPERVQNINYRGDVQPRIAPNIIITVALSRGSGDKRNDFKYRSAHYYCTNLSLGRLPKQIVTSTGPNIAILPFTNVYGEAVLCTGGNSIIQDYPGNDLRQTIWFHDMLWASPFNDDLGVRALKSDSQYRDSNSSWYKYLAQLAKEGKGFPYSELSNMK